MAATDEARREQVLAELRARGSRVTRARLAVLAALLEHRDHPTAEHLAEAVHAEHPDVHLSTVYRTLDAFEELGVVTHVHLGHGRATYHLTDDLHHHAVCDRCGHVEELPLSLFADVAARLDDECGFLLEAHHFALAGTCRTCRAAR